MRNKTLSYDVVAVYRVRRGRRVVNIRFLQKAEQDKGT
jgi:hypothetical protein